MTRNSGLGPVHKKKMPQEDIFYAPDKYDTATWQLPSPQVPELGSTDGGTNYILQNKTEEGYSTSSIDIKSGWNEVLEELVSKFGMQIPKLRPEGTQYILSNQLQTTEDSSLQAELADLLEIIESERDIPRGEIELDVAGYIAGDSPCPFPAEDQIPLAVNSSQIVVHNPIYEPVTPTSDVVPCFEEGNDLNLVELTPLKPQSQTFSFRKQVTPSLGDPKPSAAFSSFIPCTVGEISKKISTSSSKRKYADSNLNSCFLKDMTLSFKDQPTFQDDESTSSSSSSNYSNSGDFRPMLNKRARFNSSCSSSDDKREKNNYSSMISRQKKAKIEEENEKQYEEQLILNQNLQNKKNFLAERIQQLHREHNNLVMQLISKSQGYNQH